MNNQRNSAATLFSCTYTNHFDYCNILQAFHLQNSFNHYNVLRFFLAPWLNMIELDPTIEVQLHESINLSYN